MGIKTEWQRNIINGWSVYRENGYPTILIYREPTEENLNLK